MNTNKNLALALTLTTLLSFAAVSPAATPVAPRQDSKMEAVSTSTSSAFKGIEVNGGTVTFSKEGGKRTLSLSPDFKLPKTPAPHWQVIDSKGNAYLLNQLKIAGDKTNLKVALPSYIKDVAKVQIWCSFAEVNLGEATFAKAQR